MLISFFLPLKVIILLGSDGVPSYFPQIMLLVERDALVLGLSLVSVCAYICHLLCEKALDYVAVSGSTAILDKNEKIVIFERQQELAEKTYQKYVKSLSSFFFIWISILVFLCIYPLLFISVFLLFIIFFILVKFSYYYYSKEKVNDSIISNSKKISGVGFLLFFAIIIVDFLYYSPPGILYVIVCMVLSRQFFNKFSTLVMDVASLYQQQSKINALFFRKHVFQNDVGRRESSVWKFMEQSSWQSDLTDLCRSLEDNWETCESQVTWVQNSTPGIVSFNVKLLDNKKHSKLFYLKLFDNKKNAWAAHEASLLMQYNAKTLPVPPFLGAFLVAGLHCHIFEIKDFDLLPPKSLSNAYTEISSSLFTFTLDHDFVDSYKRSRPFLWDRVDQGVVNRLRIVAAISNSDELSISIVEIFSTKRQKIMSLLKKNPLVVINPDVSYGHVWKSESTHEIVASNWSRWALEPIGATWPITAVSLNKLKSLYDNELIQNPIFENINFNMIKLSALISEFDRLASRQQYEQAIELLPEVILAFEGSK